MRNKIFGGIGVVWGGLIVARWFLTGAEVNDGAYGSGQFGAVVFGAIMFACGIYYFRKGA